LYHFDRDGLVRRLAAMPLRNRVAFALACAQRMFPAYRAYATRTGRGNAAALDAALDQAWRDTVAGNLLAGQATDLARCEGLVLWVPETLTSSFRIF
jgi:uncharacterized protein YjaG (DUF416 family)